MAKKSFEERISELEKSFEERFDKHEEQQRIDFERINKRFDTLEERFEEVEGGDRDFNGDFIIDDSSENVIFNGYFGEAMLSEVKTIKGKEYLDVTISSELIDNFYFDADFKNLINDGLNTLEVFETEDEQPVKYVRFYVAIEFIGMKIVVECNVFLADLP